MGFDMNAIFLKKYDVLQIHMASFAIKYFNCYVLLLRDATICTIAVLLLKKGLNLLNYKLLTVLADNNLIYIAKVFN